MALRPSKKAVVEVTRNYPHEDSLLWPFLTTALSGVTSQCEINWYTTFFSVYLKYSLPSSNAQAHIKEKIVASATHTVVAEVTASKAIYIHHS